jgi:hypothetical protein
MKRMAGYHWAVTGAVVAFTALFVLISGAKVWATHSSTELLTELAQMMLASVYFGASGWVAVFLAVWPLFFLIVSLAETLKIRSLVYFITFGALTGALLSVPLVAIPSADQRSLWDGAMPLVSLFALSGMSGAWLFWWKVIRHGPTA